MRWRCAALRPHFLPLPLPPRPQRLMRQPPSVLPAAALQEPGAPLRLPCARRGLRDKLSGALHALRPRSRGPAGWAGARTQDPREEQGRGSIKGRKGGKNDERKKLLNSTQQVVWARLPRLGAGHASETSKFSSLFFLGSVAWYPSSTAPPR